MGGRGGGIENDRIGCCYEFYLHLMQHSCKEVHVIIIRCFLFVSVKETLVVKGCIQYRGTLLILDKGLASFYHVL